MHILIESHIPYIRGYAEAAGHRVTYLPPEEIDAKAVADVDAMIVRTRTRCDAALLEGSNVKIIATATIGTDHIDLDYCKSRGIRVANAPGCNAPAVAQYVLSVVGRSGIQDVKLGIVGVGHVGSIVQRWAEVNGIETMLCDPPRAEREGGEGGEGFHSLEELAAECNVLTFHTPLDSSTRHLVDERLLGLVRPGTLIINAARGAVVNTPALISAIEAGKVRAAIDCWEGEPNISERLLDLADVATPHIAGYSLQGKRRASAMALKAVDPTIELPIEPVSESPTLEMIVESFDPQQFTELLKADSTSFEYLRNNSSHRLEP